MKFHAVNYNKSPPSSTNRCPLKNVILVIRLSIVEATSSAVGTRLSNNVSAYLSSDTEFAPGCPLVGVDSLLEAIATNLIFGPNDLAKHSVIMFTPALLMEYPRLFGLDFSDAPLEMFITILGCAFNNSKNSLIVIQVPRRLVEIISSKISSDVSNGVVVGNDTAAQLINI